MAYTPTNWTNFPSTATPVNASNLNKIENELVALDTGKADTTALDDKVDKVAGKGLSTNDYDNTAKGIVDGVTTALAGKVDKVEGKGLSTEDYTTTEKTKLAGISAQANKVEITPVVTEGTTLATISIDGVDTDIKGSDIEVDDTPSPTSTNPLENKAVYELVQSILPEETAEGNPISISDASGLNAKSCEVSFSPVQSGSGDPSPSNIRPISGRDSLALNNRGKNFFDKTQIGDTNKYLLQDGSETTPGSGSWRITDYQPIIPSNSYVVSGMNETANNPSICWYDQSKTFISGKNYSGSTETTFNAPANAQYVRFSVMLDKLNTAQLEIGTTATAYEPYQVTTHTATFPDTVYGGSYEFVEGGLKKTLLNILDLGTITWTKNISGGKTYFYATVTGKKIGYNAQLICSQYKLYEGYYTGLGDGQISNNSSFSYIYIRDDSKANLTEEEFKTAMSGVQLCYELATPQEITLTPETIELLKGNNTLWTDGDNIELKYSADIKAYIDSQLASVSE